MMDFTSISEELAEKYIVLKEIEQLMHTNKNFADELVMGRSALTEAKKIQQEFFPMSNKSEMIIMTLLNQNFVYDEVDYSNELEDKSITNGCSMGLLLYVADAVADEINIINRKISDLQTTAVF